MKLCIAVVVGLVLALALSAGPAAAYVVQVVTTVPVAPGTSAGDASKLEDLVASAIQDVMSHVIAFTPSVMRIEDARIIGEKLYLVLFIADTEGESTIESLGGHPAPDGESNASDGEKTDAPDSSGAVQF
jgi:hypothetical protein